MYDLSNNSGKKLDGDLSDAMFEDPWNISCNVTGILTVYVDEYISYIRY